MADSEVIWMDGNLVPYGEAKVHVLSHSLHYGSAAFEGIRAYQTVDRRTAIFRGPEHFDRLLKSISSLNFSIPFTAAQLLDAAKDVIRANKLNECYVRPLVYLGDGVRGLKLPRSNKASVAIAVWPWGKYLGDEGQKRGIRATISSFRRPSVSSSMPWAKLSGNYLNSIFASRDALLGGFDEAILLDQDGYVAEGSGENIFLIDKKFLRTPNTTSILPGITRESVLQMARLLNLEVVEQQITRNQLYFADEVFFSGTAAEITPIREIDNRPIGNGQAGPTTLKMMEMFFKSVRGEMPEFKNWLTYI